MQVISIKVPISMLKIVKDRNFSVRNCSFSCLTVLADKYAADNDLL